MLNNMKVKKKLWLLLAAALLGMVILSVVSVLTMKKDFLREKEVKTRNLVEAAQTLVGHYYNLSASGKVPEAEAKKLAIAAIKSMRYENSEYFWINDMKPTMVMHPMKPEMDGTDLSDYKDPDGKKLFVAFVDTVREKKAGFVYYLWPKPGEKAPVPKVSYVLGFEPWGWVIGSGIYIDDVQAAYRGMVVKYVLITLALLALIIAISWAVSRNITRHLALIADGIGKIAKGDLTSKVPLVGQDEFGALARDLNRMSGSLSDMINNVLKSVNQVVNTVNVVKIKSLEVANAAKDQAMQTSSISASAEEMSQTITSISETTSAAAGISAEALQTAEGGKEAAELAVRTVDRVHASTLELSKTVDNLNHSVGEIGNIVNVINDITDQTNMLALNASIEAARAGEQGRGFAVVADEVRRLAERTLAATSEISGRIGTLQEESRQTTRSMSGASKEVENANSTIRQVGESLEHVATVTRNVSDQITQIATATEEQSQASSDIARNFENTLKIAKDLDRLSGDLMGAVFSLTNFGDQIRSNTSVFKTRIDPLTLLDLAKTDHQIFVNKLAAGISGAEKIAVESLPDHHGCRFGKWYDGEGKDVCGSMAGYRKIDPPHQKIHALARQAATLGNAGDKEKAKGIQKEMETISRQIVALLEEIGTACKAAG
ncbi:MAG: cache domain-containing protein [bacterium]|jgi:methyl-accepting chemotaxis protein